ncbi:MAG: sensor histidine kinase [Oscillospiraceae bacterium]
MSMAKITRKGLVNSLVSTTIVLVAILMFCIIYIKGFFYNGVMHVVFSQISVLDTMSEQLEYSSQEEYKNQLIDLVHHFSESQKMELILLDNEDNTVTTSSGFEVLYRYNKTQNLKTGTEDTVSIGSLGSQSIMQFNHKIKNTDFKLVIMVLIDAINAEIKLLMVVLITIMIAILIFVVISNTYFTNSIVNTIWTISRTTNKIAKGDFKTRVIKRSNDEVGELCDAINNMAEELGENERMKNEFISSISHELRTPLTAIKGWAETLEFSSNNEEIAQKGLNIIVSEADRLSAMVEELLDFSRFQRMGSTINCENLDIIAIIADVVLMFGDKAKREGKSLNWNGFDQQAIISVDQSRIKQVLINVIDNALKYTETGGIIDVLAFFKTFLEQQYIVIKISDNGCGIKEEDLDKVKTKFFKANYTKRGSGIGLAVADEIVRLHRGQLHVESVENQGTSVEIMLPILEPLQGNE